MTSATNDPRDLPEVHGFSQSVEVLADGRRICRPGFMPLEVAVVGDDEIEVFVDRDGRRMRVVMQAGKRAKIHFPAAF